VSFRSIGFGALALLFVGVSGPVFPRVGSAAVFENFNPDRHVRALTGAISVGAELPVNANFLIDEREITGVGLNSVALITPQHFVTADHIVGDPNAPRIAQFRGSDGIVRSYTAGTSQQVVRGTDGTDIRIYTLDHPVPVEHGVRPLKIVTAESQIQFQGRQIYVIGRRTLPGGDVAQVGGRNTVNVVTNATLSGTRPTRVVEWIYDSVGDNGGIADDEIGLQGGDSGLPVLMRAGGEIALIGANFGIQQNISPSDTVGLYRNYATALGFYEAEINAITQVPFGSGQGFSISTISVTAIPEPGTFALCSLLGGTAVVRSRRRRCRPGRGSAGAASLPG